MRVLRPFVSGLSVASLVACLQVVDSEAVSRAEAASRPVQVLTPGARLHFEPTSGDEQFVARGAGYSLLLGASASTLILAPAKPSREAPRPARSQPVVLLFRLMGANADARVETSEALPGRSHYFRGADPSRWRHDVPHFGRVTYRQVYPGTDLTFYGTAGALEHDFVVAPGSDPGRIRLGIEGASTLRIDEAGDLVMTTALGDVRQKAPVAYQLVDGERREVVSRYVLPKEGEVAFRVGPYEGHLPLVIDPVLSYATFLGGSSQDSGLDVSIAPDGSLWLAGSTFSSDLPGAGNGWTGDQDAFVSHLTADGETLLSTTYVGGGNADFANRLKATGSGVYVVGATVSADFPSPDAACAVCRNPPAGLQSWEIYYPPSDAQSFLLKLDASGDIQHAAVFGGGDLDSAYVLGLDGAGRVHVGSNSCGDGFPTTSGAYRQARTPAADASDPNNECDVAVARFAESAGGFALTYGTYLGGSGADFVAGLAVTSSGADWVVGGTTSGNFPTTAGARQATNGGGFDAFVARLAPGGGAPGYSTYLGGSALDYPYDVALDGSGNAYVAGRTESADFPTTLGAFQRASAGGSDGFVAKFNRTGSLAWSTRLGGSGFDWPFAVAVDSTGAPYVAGQTASPDFPTLLPVQGGPGGAEDAFVTKIASTGSRLLWSTFLGGAGFDQAHGLAPDGQGGVWIAGVTAGGIAPTANAAQPVFGGGSTDALLARLDESASIRALPAQLNFLRTRVGRTRGPRQVFVVNDGSAPVDILGIALGGSDPGDYAISNGCPVGLDPGQSCAVAVTFAPVAAGSRSATLLVSTSASAVPSSVPLTGTGF
ncbi:MAG TPA: choice-of-anchor D domain-containing protein [Vicinamibacteria bacterium]|nr:choice-of-anchor D domain-containing protein [Vicinamibacteria bacterium]